MTVFIFTPPAIQQKTRPDPDRQTRGFRSYFAPNSRPCPSFHFIYYRVPSKPFCILYGHPLEEEDDDEEGSRGNCWASQKTKEAEATIEGILRFRSSVFLLLLLSLETEAVEESKRSFKTQSRFPNRRAEDGV